MKLSITSNLIHLFIGCICGLGMYPSSAIDIYDVDISTLNLPAPVQWYTEKVREILYKASHSSDLYLFLKEAQQEDTLNNKNQTPPPTLQNIFNVYTKSPIIESYLGSYKLHNISLSSWRPAIAWSKIILRVHNDKKVTGWVLNDGGATYNTVQASEDITDAFLGEVINNSIKFHRVTETGSTPTDGYEENDLTWNHAHDVLKGEWRGGSRHVKPQDQKGNVHISMLLLYYYEFDIKDAINKFQKDSTKWNDAYINSLLDQKTRSQVLSFDEMELILAWHVIKAWDTYMSTISYEEIKKFFSNEKTNILNFRVYLKSKYTSAPQGGNEVPMQFGINRLNISNGVPDHTFWSQKNTFWGDDNGTSKFPERRISKMAHEILGHGLFMRYTPELVTYKKIRNTDELGYLEHEGLQLAEGLATAVEYIVAKKLNEPDITKYGNLKSFVGPPTGTIGRYANKDKNFPGIYWPGVESAINAGYIDESGTIQWENIPFFKKIIDGYEASAQSATSWNKPTIGGSTNT